MSTSEELAGASITGIASAYAQLRRLDRQQAMQEIRERLAHHRIPAERIVEVLSRVASGHVDADRPSDAAALRLLVDAGADLDRARALREEARHQRVLRIGDASLGG